MEQQTESQASNKSAQRLRLLLLLAIAVVIAGSVVLYLQIEDRKVQKAKVAQGPVPRAERALTAADRAVVNEEYAQARQHFTEAAAALDEALKASPKDVKVLRVRMSVDDRLAHLDQKEGQVDWAETHATAALKRAAELLELAPTEARARQDRLSTALRLADMMGARRRLEEAAKVLTDAGEAVEKTLEILPPGHATRLALAEAWQGVAEKMGTLEPHKKAIAHAEEALKSAEVPLEGLDHLYGVLSRALDMSGASGEGLPWLKRAIAVLRLRLELKPGEPSIRRALAARLSQLGREMELEQPHSARKAYTESLTLRRALLVADKENPEARRDLAVALSQWGRFLGRLKEDEGSKVAYGEAVSTARPLKGSHPDLLIKLLGSYAQVLGRIDEMVPSKEAAAEAWAMAKGRAGEKGDRTRMVAATAALRHARLLRADPKPDKKQALAVAREGVSLLDALKRPRGQAKKVRAGLETLMAELKR